MGNQKLIAGAVMVLLNLVLLSPIATSMVEGAVEKEFETYPYDSACANSDCTEAEEDWATSTSERTYYAWNLTNADEVMAGEEAVYEKLGPFNYDITYTREIVDFDKEAGTLTYTESKVFTCAEDTPNDCNTEITQLNIPFQPQVVGATGTAINGIMDLTKVGFAAGAIGQEMESFSAAKAAALWVSNTMAGGYVAYTDGVTLDETNVSIVIGKNWYDQFDGYFAYINGSGMNNMTGNGEMITYTQAIQGAQAAEGSVTFAGNQSIGDLSYAFNSAIMPTGENAALSTMLGVLLYAGHCDAYPTATYAEVMADAANGFANVGTMQRASIWQYTAMADETTLDINATIATDYAVCFGLGGLFANVYGGADSDWFQDTTGTAVDASTRIMNQIGISLDNMVAMNLLFGGNGEETPTGLLATNADSTAFGLATFAAMDDATAMATYSLDATQYGAIATWVGGWLTSQSSLPMVLLGGTGTMTAEQFVNASFGAEDPVNGGYLANSLNMGGAWSAVFAPGSPAVDITAEQSGNILYGPLGLTGATGATLFLYGELTGMTPPLDLATMAPGPAMEWNTSTVAMIYGVDENAAAAMRALMMEAIYGDFVPEFLVGTFGSSGQYMTMPLNNWLYGWRDPVSAFVAGDVTDPTLGWSKLETNETFYGSGGISTGNASVYVMCTGHNTDCEKGEAVSEDGSNELSWRNMDMMNATFGLVTVETLSGTTGGFLTGEGDMVNAGGYAIAEVVCDGKDDVKGIQVDDCSASVDPTTNPITAKLIKSFTLLDATTPALPVYFGSEISLMSEDVSGLIIAGSSTSTFYLDKRTGTELATTPNMDDLQPVFQIVSASEIEDDDAEEMEDAIVHNQEYMTWWTNFDTPFDYVAPLLYILGISLIAVHFVLSPKDEEWIQE
ncbi:MAG: hypothetical protein CMB57_00390 [Euryarchaeota archaeon]|nr:hypothetical protein [Euryarchaeota archaeon]|tara:strand:+ start:955 stop:3666 length:2712 start_codon:yes stop_codon:yes gene_type:complete